MPEPKSDNNGLTIYVNFFDEIDFIRVNFFMERTTQLLKQQPDTLYFLFSSTGGDVNAGIVLFSYLRALPVKKIMHSTGSIDSIANVIFLAGDVRYASPESTFLFHGVASDFKGRLQLSQVIERKSSIEEDENTIAAIIGKHTSLTQEDVRKFFQQGETKQAAFAKQYGIVHDIREAKIPKGAIVVDYNFNVLK